MCQVILQGYLAKFRQEYLLFHRFYVQNGLQGLFSIKFCITEVISVTRHFLGGGKNVIFCSHCRFLFRHQ